MDHAAEVKADRTVIRRRVDADLFEERHGPPLAPSAA
jgi:hypothetical protein